MPKSTPIVSQLNIRSQITRLREMGAIAPDPDGRISKQAVLVSALAAIQDNDDTVQARLRDIITRLDNAGI